MGTRIDQQPQGFAAIDPRWTKDGLRANDGAAGNSDYTEANPEPGQMAVAATNNLGQLEVSGGQSRTVDAEAGFGGAADLLGARVRYRLDGETAADWRGWNPPNWPNHWEGLQATKGDLLDVDVIPSSQEPVILHNSAFFDRWDTATATYIRTALPSVSSAAGPLAGGVCVVPGSDRILVVRVGTVSIAAGVLRKVAHVHASTDGGATWSEQAAIPLPGIPDGLTLASGSGSVASMMRRKSRW